MIVAFKIDNGELNLLTKQDAFCLGVEFGILYDRLCRGEGINEAIHPENIDRMITLCEALEMRYDLVPHTDRPRLVTYDGSPI